MDDDDMTPEEFDRLAADGEPVELITPPGGIRFVYGGGFVEVPNTTTTTNGAQTINLRWVE